MFGLILYIFIQFAVFAYIIKLIYAESEKITNVNIYLYGHDSKSSGLNSTATWMTSVASNFQTAAVLYVGFYFGATYGLTMLLTALSFSFGIYLLRKHLVRLNSQERNILLGKAKLPYNRLYRDSNKFFSEQIIRIIYIVILASAVLEVWFGTQMVNELSLAIINDTNILIGQYEGYLLTGTFILIGSLLFYYVYISGYRAIVITDIVQLILIFVLLVLLLLGTAVYLFKNANNFSLSALCFGGEAISNDPLYYIFLIIGAIVLNTFWQFVDPQQWQRAIAADTGDIYISSLTPSCIWTFITWSLPIICGAILAGAGISSEVESFVSMPIIVLYNTLKVFDSDIALTLSVVLVSFGASGIIAAAISSADTAIMAFISNTIGDADDISSNELVKIRQKAIAITVSTCMAAYGLLMLQPKVENVIFAISSAQMIFVFYFFRFIRSVGDFKIETKLVIITNILYITAGIVSVTFNLFGPVYHFIGSVTYLLPLLFLVTGAILAKR